jgi:hypothetical protein
MTGNYYISRTSRRNVPTVCFKCLKLFDIETVASKNKTVGTEISRVGLWAAVLGILLTGVVTALQCFDLKLQ